MWYLREGLVVGGAVEGGLELVDLDRGAVRDLDTPAAEAALALARGLEGEPARSAAALLGAAFVEEREEPFDRVLLGRLAGLDEEHAWALQAGGEGLVRLAELCHSALRHARPDLDQHPALPETAARRALELLRRAGPGAEVALVGDDDLVALPAASLGLRVTVLDLDEALLDLEGLLAERLGLELALARSDLREPLDPGLAGRFDGFCTDAEPTRECIVLFLSRGLVLLRPGGIGLASCSEDFEDLLVAAAAEMGLERLALLRRFSSYRTVTGGLSGYRSDLHVLRAREGARPVVPAAARFDEELFPFGLAGGEHLLVTAGGCSAEAASGASLAELARTLVDAGPEAVRDDRPLPVRVVRARGPAAVVQVTVRGDGTTVDLDLSPAPAGEAGAEAVLLEVRGRLGATSLSARSLRRIDEPVTP